MKSAIIAKSSKQYLSEEFMITSDFKRFNQKFDVFNRSLWDDKVEAKNFFRNYDIANYVPKKSKGFDH